jgi:HPt (histidine-containing phosphotransfer) domain-containing protein
MSESSTPNEAILSHALDHLWQRFLPEIRERVAILESAASAAAQGNLNEELRETARAAAHKLAGVLGTFGLPRGTDLARELEVAFGPDLPVSASAPNLAPIAKELRESVESRKPAA